MVIMYIRILAEMLHADIELLSYLIFSSISIPYPSFSPPDSISTLPHSHPQTPSPLFLTLIPILHLHSPSLYPRAPSPLSFTLFHFHLHSPSLSSLCSISTLSLSLTLWFTLPPPQPLLPPFPHLKGKVQLVFTGREPLVF